MTEQDRIMLIRWSNSSREKNAAEAEARKVRELQGHSQASQRQAEQLAIMKRAKAGLQTLLKV